MSYDSLKRQFGRDHVWIATLTLDRCANTAGFFPCTATETGDAKCYNTLASCNDTPNYAIGFNQEYKFSENGGPTVIGSDQSTFITIPALLSINITPAEIDLKGGIGSRSRVTLKFKDFPTDDKDADPYIDERTLIARENGTFWTKLRARNPNYQNRKIVLTSCYLVDGFYRASNSKFRTFYIDSMDVSNGVCTITAKDPLKLASSGKALAPAVSNGQLDADLTAAATTATLKPVGVGDTDYAASGKIRINNEVLSFTRVTDTLTLTRAQNNTTAVEHSENDTVQQCLEYNDQVNVIVEDLLTNYANIDPDFIPTETWQDEIDTFISGLLDGIVTKPTDVNKLLKELSESMPHYLWWDEEEQEINLTALKAPPTDADVLDMDGNLVKQSVKLKDKPQMRLSTIVVNFGQFDPTKKLDEPSNYQQSYERKDQNSIEKYGSNEVRVINSRWISSGNKAAALQLAALYGRRFSDIPRHISFDLDPKDSDVWIGQSRSINHRDILDFNGVPIDTIFQILSARESKLFNYTALEYTYGEALPDDEGGGDPNVDLVILSVDQLNANLRTIYDTLFPAPDAATEAKFIVEDGVIVGSDTPSNIAMQTGTWPAGATLTLVNNGYIVGAGGAGQHASSSPSAIGGGLGLDLNHDLTLVNNNIIGGGGGGGGYDINTQGGDSASCDGGGGAGSIAGAKGGGLTWDLSGEPTTVRNSESGNIDTGGAGARVTYIGATEIIAAAGNGGNLGQAGGSATGSGGSGGFAIDKNGNTLTITVNGSIQGSIIT